MTITLTLESGFPSSSSVLDRGLSEDARKLRLMSVMLTDFTPSYARQDRVRGAIRALKAAFVLSLEESWDGYDAKAARPEALRFAIEFLGSLSSSTPIPEISIDSDGDVALEWDFEPRRVFSVRVGRDGTLHYAGLLGTVAFHGVEHLQEGIPETIAAGIGRVVGAD